VITTNWGALWALIILLIAACQFFHKGVVADYKEEKGVWAFGIITLVTLVQLLLCLFWPGFPSAGGG
jgi:hypothetical protein